MSALPRVTIVFLVYNRRELLRTSLQKMLFEADYPAELIDVIVVDNASTDGSAAMVRDDFGGVQLIERDSNIGVSAWNDGFAVARGDFVLALDDDCYLPADGLRRAVEAARQHEADLVSFTVAADEDRSYRFTDLYETGLLTFWGCSVLMRREVLEALGGYEPDIFVWANELDFMVRFFDHGFCHLHLPEVTSIHMRPVAKNLPDYRSSSYPLDTRNVAYIAGRHLRPRDAAEAIVAMLATMARDAYRVDRAALRAVPSCVRGFVDGLRRRTPVSNAEVSRLYRRNLRNYASPWWFSRPPHEFFTRPAIRLLAALRPTHAAPAAPRGRREKYFAERARYYPDTAATLKL